MTLKRPKLIYKYHKNNQHLLSLLIDGQLWFSHQNELNDPYDCKFALSDKFLISLLKESSDTLLKDLQEKIPNLNSINKDRFFDKILPILKSNKWMNEFYSNLFEKSGWSVCCFSASPLNEIMWAHYANNHKGVCLEFDLSKTPELYEKLQPVTYEDTFPEIDTTDDLINALLRKRTAWSQEEEWRIITNVRGTKPFNKESLTAICFGCYADRLFIENIIKTTKESGYEKIGFKQMNFRIKGITLKPLYNPKTLTP
ncbi:MAG: DUF2971 domain-containing protein [Bacteroidales bacterium]|nr:DUF2971 domain-containing protein [Bacteroidales bacterium]